MLVYLLISNKMILANAIQVFLEYSQINNSKNTTKNYFMALKKLLPFFNKETKIQDINTTKLKELFFQLREKNIKTSSLNAIHRVFNTFFNFYVYKEIIVSNPMGSIKKFRLKKHEISSSEIDKSLNLLTLSEVFEVFKNDLQMNLLLSLLYTTGARIHEILAIQLKNINGNEILLEQTKTRHQKYIFINKTVNRLLWKYIRTIKNDNGYLFPAAWGRQGHMHYNTFRGKLKKYFPFRFHSFRHTWFAERVEDVNPFALRDLSGTSIQTINHYAKRNKSRAFRTFQKTDHLSAIHQINRR